MKDADPEHTQDTSGKSESAEGGDEEPASAVDDDNSIDGNYDDDDSSTAAAAAAAAAAASSTAGHNVGNNQPAEKTQNRKDWRCDKSSSWKTAAAGPPRGSRGLQKKEFGGVAVTDQSPLLGGSNSALPAPVVAAVLLSTGSQHGASATNTSNSDAATEDRAQDLARDRSEGAQGGDKEPALTEDADDDDDGNHAGVGDEDELDLVPTDGGGTRSPVPPAVAVHSNNYGGQCGAGSSATDNTNSDAAMKEANSTSWNGGDEEDSQFAQFTDFTLYPRGVKTPPYGAKQLVDGHEGQESDYLFMDEDKLQMELHRRTKEMATSVNDYTETHGVTALLEKMASTKELIRSLREDQEKGASCVHELEEANATLKQTCTAGTAVLRDAIRALKQLAVEMSGFDSDGSNELSQEVEELLYTIDVRQFIIESSEDAEHDCAEHEVTAGESIGSKGSN
jgi:hypothetical protein